MDSMRRRGRPRFVDPKHDTRSPPAIKLPAEPGWRVVWVDPVDAPDGTIALHPTVGVLIEPVTFWGIEAPEVRPDSNDPTLMVSTLGMGAKISPLHGPLGWRLPRYARVFRISRPTDWRTDETLLEECWKWLRRDYARLRKEQAALRKPTSKRTTRSKK